ncbi:MAG TPA: WD40 repeat domain-containing protein [Planctomycetota bacterium]|nr:WD40 repeat domain-containing protein [Planctomycetota bacterium]
MTVQSSIPFHSERRVDAEFCCENRRIVVFDVINERADIAIYDVRTGALEYRIDFPHETNERYIESPDDRAFLRVSPDGRLLVSGAGRFQLKAESDAPIFQRILIWDANDGSKLKTVETSDVEFYSLYFAPRDSRHLFLFDDRDGFMEMRLSPPQSDLERSHVTMLDWQTGKTLHVFAGYPPRNKCPPVFSKDGSILVLYRSENRNGLFWNTTTGALEADYALADDAWISDFSPDGERVVTTNGQILDWRTNQYLCDFAKRLNLSAPIERGEFRFLDNATIVSRFLISIRNGYEHCHFRWVRLYPERWWGPVCLPEFWVAILLLMGWLWSWRRDWTEFSVRAK